MQADSRAANDREKIIQLVRRALPDAQIALEPLRKDGKKFSLKVTSSAFSGKDPVERHRMIYDALKRQIDFDLIELTLSASAPDADHIS